MTIYLNQATAAKSKLYCERVKFGLFYLPQPTFAAVALNIISLRSLLRFNPYRGWLIM
jgi:hypothetical protein